MPRLGRYAGASIQPRRLALAYNARREFADELWALGNVLSALLEGLDPLPSGLSSVCTLDAARQSRENPLSLDTGGTHNEKRLESWKEIGNYLAEGIPTSRRWEREEGLPVHRHTHKSRTASMRTRLRLIPGGLAQSPCGNRAARDQTLWEVSRVCR